MTAGTEPQADAEPLESRLSAFSSSNPESSLKLDEAALMVTSPWGDPTIAIRVSPEATRLVEALNNVRLPPRFSAIWHRDSGDFEIIFAPLPASDQLMSRSFDFQFEDVVYHCEYARASERLELIAAATRAVEPPLASNHRNLTQLRTFLRFQKKQGDSDGLDELLLVSFWIRGVHVPEASLVDVTRHLNFFMHFFDRNTPRVLVHEAEASVRTPLWGARAPSGAFPSTLSGRQVDPYLLGLWEEATSVGDSVRRFLTNYQILEYSSFYWMREEVQRAVKRVLLAPNLFGRIEAATREVIEVLANEKTSDEAKMVAVVQATVEPGVIWAELVSRGDFFFKPTEFDGGFALPALLKDGWKLDDFSSAWIPKLPDSLRKIRNALVHAREQRQSKCISPTSRNQALLRPWAAVVGAVASQTIAFGDWSAGT